MCYFIAFIFLMNKCVFSLRSCIGWVENPKTSLFLLEIWGYKYFVCADFFKMIFTAFNIESICLRTASFLTPICKVFPFFVILGPQQSSQARGSNQSCNSWPIPQPQPCRIQAAPVTYTTTHGNAGSPTH